MSLSFLNKQLYNRCSKVLFVVSLTQFTIAFYTLNAVCHSQTSLNTNLNNSTETLYTTYKINDFSADMGFKLFTISKMKNRHNGLYLKMILILSGGIEINPGPVNRHQIKKENFEVFNNEGLHSMHLNINRLLDKKVKQRYITSSSNTAVGNWNN